MEPDAIIDEIGRAFADVAREDGVTLHEAVVIDDYGSADDRAAARRLDTDGRWQDIPDPLIEDYGGMLTFLDVKGFRYYLPAYMIWILRHPGCERSFPAMCAIFLLGWRAGVERTGPELERFRSFDEAQSRAIGRFLHFLAGRGESGNHEMAREALDAYWGRSCEA